MKHKKTKKLSFNKLTVASLNGIEMAKMKAGDDNGDRSIMITRTYYCSWCCP